MLFNFVLLLIGYACLRNVFVLSDKLTKIDRRKDLMYFLGAAE